MNNFIAVLIFCAILFYVGNKNPTYGFGIWLATVTILVAYFTSISPN